ncbi:uncharacterized protein EV420DRAFT_1483499 [Desarmillaria tabescens]|uniref:Uncharacterized protein n=1 Tax=Armillaria tabescens TaxID=1929756 RepID=A0AA39MW44_ARMTA|nr:uncharacterized protein EV420DRAFT_1483499 [Desarmillaria tabescens]KAK0448249.1 hypothetical protein EV420DRAFT_1483499 [Desarmillaria tabescens]
MTLCPHLFRRLSPRWPCLFPKSPATPQKSSRTALFNVFPKNEPHRKVDLETQERWARPLVPAYHTARGHGQAILDAFLNGLFIAYHGRFGCSLGAPVNCRDAASIKKWKQRSIDALARLMFTVYRCDSLTFAQSAPSENKMPNVQTPKIDLESSTQDLHKLLADFPPSSPPSAPEDTPLSSSSPLKMSCDSSIPPTLTSSSDTTTSDNEPGTPELPTLQELLGQRKASPILMSFTVRKYPDNAFQLSIEGSLGKHKCGRKKLIQQGGEELSEPSKSLKNRLHILNVAASARRQLYTKMVYAYGPDPGHFPCRFLVLS